MKTIMTTDNGIWWEIESQADADLATQMSHTAIKHFYQWSQKDAPEGLHWLILEAPEGRAVVAMAAWEQDAPEQVSEIPRGSHTTGFANADPSPFEAEIRAITQHMGLAYAPNHMGRVAEPDEDRLGM